MINNLEQPVNQILAALSQPEYSRLAPYLRPVKLNVGKVLYYPGEIIQEVYFPEQAVISLVSIFTDGSTSEISLIGNDGMIGLPVILGSNCASCCSIVQVSGNAFKLSADILKQEVRRGEQLPRLLLLYTHVHLIRVAQTAVCNRKHLIEEQFSRWLLSVGDCLQTDELPLTQEAIANMLGVRRTSVSEVAIKLQKKGIINYKRGHIKIVDRDSLETTACECYELVRNVFRRSLSSDPNIVKCQGIYKL